MSHDLVHWLHEYIWCDAAALADTKVDLEPVGGDTVGTYTGVRMQSLH